MINGLKKRIENFLVFWGKYLAALIAVTIVCGLLLLILPRPVSWFIDLAASLWQLVLPILEAFWRAVWDAVIYLLESPRFWKIALAGLSVVAALFTTWAILANFVCGMYELEKWKDGWDHVTRTLFGQPGATPLSLAVKEGKIVQEVGDLLRRMGGPGALFIKNDSAIVTEQNGCLKRVLVGPKFDKLERFEKVWEVVDLRPKRWVLKVSAMTKEGIPVTIPVEVLFKIEDDNQPPTTETPYPATEKAVFAAATSKWIRDPGGGESERAMDWASRTVKGETEGGLRTIISRYYLDQLIRPIGYKWYLRQAIWKELEDRLGPYDIGWTARLTGNGNSPQELQESLKKTIRHYLNQLDDKDRGMCNEINEMLDKAPLIQGTTEEIRQRRREINERLDQVRGTDQVARDEVAVLLDRLLVADRPLRKVAERFLDRLQDRRKESDGILDKYLGPLINWTEKDRKHPRQLLWEDMERELNDYIGRIAGVEEERNPLPRQAMAERLKEQLRGAVAGFGVKILNVSLDIIKPEYKLGDSEIGEKIFGQWYDNWQTEWESRLAGVLVEGESQGLLTQESVRAGAQRRFAMDISKVFKDLGEDYRNSDKSGKMMMDLILMRLVKVLENAYFDPDIQLNLPDQAASVLLSLRTMLSH